MSKGPGSVRDRLQRADQLVSQGKFEEALQTVEALASAEELSPEDRLAGQLLKSRIRTKQGDFEEALQLAQDVFTEIQGQEPSLQTVDAHIAIAEALECLGNFEESLEAISQGDQALAIASKESPAEIARRKGHLEYSKGRNYWKKGDLEPAMIALEQSLTLRKELGKKQEMAWSLHSIGNIYVAKGELNQALEYYQQSLALRKEFENLQDIASSLNNIGSVYLLKGELTHGLEYLQQSLTIDQEIGNPQDIAVALMNIGAVYRLKGELTQALEYCQQALTLFKEIGNQQDIAMNLTNIGGVYRLKGELTQALEYCQQALTLFKELGNQQDIAMVLGNIGITYRMQGELEAAVSHLEQSLSIFDKIGHNLWVAACLFELVCVTLEIGARDQAQEYLRRLHQIHDQDDNKIISQGYRVAKGLVLKSSSRARDRVAAQELLEDVVDEEVVNHEITVQAMLHLCELLLDELKAYGDQAVFREAQALINKIYTLAQQQLSFTLVVDALILKSKFALIAGNLAKASQFLDQARLTADEKDLGSLATKVATERQRLTDQYDTWQRLIQTNAPFSERLEQARLTEYIQAAQRAVNIAQG
ncbi:MAG: tetratricopeptide repeat protein [Candidatus Heimdallarchaeota archaeon]